MKKIIILLGFLLFFLNCEYFTLMPYKEWLEKSNGEDTIFYVAGQYDSGGGIQQACYWKIKDNDINQVLLPGALNSKIFSIFVYGDNIYTCGEFNGNQARYWINDKVYELEGSLFMPSRAWSIDVHNGNVYIAGYYTSGGLSQACYWVNGKLYNIEKKGTFSEAKSIYIEDNRINDLYIVGFYNNAGNYSCYWKNGDLFDLPSIPSSVANSIFIINENIFIAGDNGPNYGYWDNNNNFTILQPVPGPGSAQAANSIYIYGKDIYIAGSAAGGPHAVYWKNNQPVELNLGISNANSICIYNGDVYVAGQITTGLGIACYWKNGNRFDLNDGYAYSIFVARSKNVTN